MVTRDLSWQEHVEGAAQVASLLAASAEKIADAEIRSALVTAAAVIDTHIRKGILAIEAERDFLVIDPVNGLVRLD